MPITGLQKQSKKPYNKQLMNLKCLVFSGNLNPRPSGIARSIIWQGFGLRFSRKGLEHSRLISTCRTLYKIVFMSLLCFVCIVFWPTRQESTNERCRNTMKDLILPNTISQRMKNWGTCMPLGQQQYRTLRFKLQKYCMKKAQYRKPSIPLWAVSSWQIKITTILCSTGTSL